MPQTQYEREDVNSVFAPVATATEVFTGDFCALVSGEVVPANDFAWAGSTGATQYNLIAALLGQAFQYKPANVATVYGNSTANIIGVATSGVYSADLDTATTLIVGDFISLAKNPSANELLPQTVTKVASLPLAIGVVVEAGTSLTRATFRLIPTVVPFAPAPATTTSTTTTSTTTTTTTSTTTTT